MIKDHCFKEEWLDKFKGQAAHRRIDKIILEKMIHALHLLERLKANGLEFVFKGGTSLVLLLAAASTRLGKLNYTLTLAFTAVLI